MRYKGASPDFGGQPSRKSDLIFYDHLTDNKQVLVLPAGAIRPLDQAFLYGELNQRRDILRAKFFGKVGAVIFDGVNAYL